MNGFSILIEKSDIQIKYRDEACTGPLKVSYALVECTVNHKRMRVIDTPRPTAQMPAGGINRFNVDVRAVDGETVTFAWYAPAWDGEPQRAAERFADAWALLAAGIKAADADSAEFDRQLAIYTAASPKPELPEEARRYKVQAEAAVKAKDFETASERFSQALKIAPWWPQGRFNLALIYGELGLNARASAEMRRYLRLAVDAPNARQAQDKIYEWEDSK